MQTMRLNVVLISFLASVVPTVITSARAATHAPPSRGTTQVPSGSGSKAEAISTTRPHKKPEPTETEKSQVALKPGPFGELFESEPVPPPPKQYDEHAQPEPLALGPVLYNDGPAVPCGAKRTDDAEGAPAFVDLPTDSLVSTARRLEPGSASSSYTITQTFSTSSSSPSCVCTSEYRNGYGYYYSGTQTYSYTDTLDDSYTVTGITVQTCGTSCGATSITITVAGITVGTTSCSYTCSCSVSDYMQYEDTASLTDAQAALYNVGGSNTVTVTFNGNYAISAVAVTIEYSQGQPTPAPTSTPQPTSTPLPTNLPTLAPTMSFKPTSKPTPVPTAQPSPAPTPQPTLVPTTPQPTAECTKSGQGVSDETGLCIDCPAGKYDNNITITSHSCLWCPVGKFQADSGKTYCDDCDEGKLSYADRTNCGACEAGQYSFNDTSCEDCTSGKYAPTAQEGDCLACSEGFYTGVDIAATNCEGCDAGKYSVAESVNCTLCSAGQYSYSKAEACTDCSAGTYSAASGAETCVSCVPGYYQASTKQTSCNPCNPGSIASANGATSCIECSSGTYAEAAASSCTKCDGGYYSNTTGGARNCTQCAGGTFSTTASAVCETCSSGKFSSPGAASCDTCIAGTAARAGSADCLTCDAGFYSAAGAEYCTACPAGNYNTRNKSATCTACPAGYYENLGAATECAACKQGTIAATAGSTNCADCSSGTYSQAAASSCTKCDAGTYSETAASNCTQCNPGTYSLGAASECVLCEIGKKAPDFGQATRCDDCAGGTYQDKNGSTSCNNCTVGRYAVSTGLSSCEACPEGQFAETSGALYCEKCSSAPKYGIRYWSEEGAGACDQCVLGYFANNIAEGDYPDCEGATQTCAATQCAQCPEKGIVCDSYGLSIESLVMEKGWYRFTATSADFRQCEYPENCVHTNESGADICIKGAVGPLCSKCDDLYYLRDASQRCESCIGSPDWYIGPLIGLLLVLVGLLFLYSQRKRIMEFQEKHHHHIEAFSFRSAACFVTLQIIMLLQENRKAVGGKPVPKPYGTFIASLHFLALDMIQFLPFSCAYGQQMDHFDALVFNTVLPLTLFIVVMLIAYALDMKDGRKGPLEMLKRLGETYEAKAEREKAKAAANREAADSGRDLTKEIKPTNVKTVFNYFMQAALLILPATSLRIAKSIRCDYFDCETNLNGKLLTFETCTEDTEGGAGYAYLQADYTIDCMNSDYQSMDRYYSMVTYAGLMMLIYPIGIPLGLFCALYRIKDKLNPPDKLEHVAIKHRKDDEDGLLKKEPIAAFAMHYRPHVWYYEVYALLRRLVLTSLSLVFSDLGSTTIFVLTVSLITLVIEKETQPHVNMYLTAFTYVLHWQVILVILFTLLLDADMTQGTGAIMISVALLIVNIGMICIVLFDTRETDKKVNQILHSLDRAKSDLRRSMLSEGGPISSFRFPGSSPSSAEETKFGAMDVDLHEGDEDTDGVELTTAGDGDDEEASVANIDADDIHHIIDDKDVAHIIDDKDVMISPRGAGGGDFADQAPRPDGVETSLEGRTSPIQPAARKPTPKVAKRLKPPGKREGKSPPPNLETKGTLPEDTSEIAVVETRVANEAML